MLKKMYIYTMEYYSAVEKRDMEFAGKWMELEKNHPEWDNPEKNMVSIHL